MTVISKFKKVWTNVIKTWQFESLGQPCKANWCQHTWNLNIYLYVLFYDIINKYIQQMHLTIKIPFLHLGSELSREACRFLSAGKGHCMLRLQTLVLDCRTFGSRCVRYYSCNPTNSSNYPTHRQLYFATKYIGILNTNVKYKNLNTIL